MALSPAQNSAIKVGVNFVAVVFAFWTADASMAWYRNYRATKASKESAPAGNGGGAPPSSQGAGK